MRQWLRNNWFLWSLLIEDSNTNILQANLSLRMEQVYGNAGQFLKSYFNRKQGPEGSSSAAPAACVAVVGALSLLPEKPLLWALKFLHILGLGALPGSGSSLSESVLTCSLICFGD